MPQYLEITQNTVFKRKPLQSSQLAADEMVAIPKGNKYVLQSYAYADAEGDFDGHIKFALGEAKDYIQGLTTWYVYEEHAQVLEDGKVVYPQDEQEDKLTLKITQNTILKRSPLPSNQLAAADTEPAKQGSTFELQSYAYANEDGEFNNHIKFALGDPQEFIRGLTTWYVYEQHAQVFYDRNQVYPPIAAAPARSNPPAPPATPKPPTPPAYSGPTIRLPGYGTVYLEQPIVFGGMFTWAEATKDGNRIPHSSRIVSNIIALARALEKPRKQLGRPFRITSWYRDPDSNRRVGGARYSMHLYGKAADIQIVGYSQRQAAKDLAWWPGGLGSYAGWIHLDTGPKRRWRL